MPAGNHGIEGLVLISPGSHTPFDSILLSLGSLIFNKWLPLTEDPFFQRPALIFLNVLYHRPIALEGCKDQPL